MSIFTNTRRILRTGFLNFWRNGVVSLSSILVMVVALFMIGSTILISAFLNTALEDLKSKVDINIYLVPDAPQEEVQTLTSNLRELPEVQDVLYLSREEVLSNFRDRHENDQLTLQALEEIGENPFGGIINVKATDPDQYGSIENFLTSEAGLAEGAGSIIDHTNYNQNRMAIERLSSLIDGLNKMGLVAIGTLALISILITFNTIRLAIYTAREEIAIMRLVGARSSYVRGPFVVEGILYGLVSALIAIALFYPITLWLKNSTASFYQGIDLFQYYMANFNQIFAILVGAGIALGAISSYLAVRKYLKV